MGCKTKREAASWYKPIPWNRNHAKTKEQQLRVTALRPGQMQLWQKRQSEDSDYDSPTEAVESGREDDRVDSEHEDAASTSGSVADDGIDPADKMLPDMW